MAVRLADETRRPVRRVALRLHGRARGVRPAGLWQRIDALDGRSRARCSWPLRGDPGLVNAQTRWFLRDGHATADMAGTIARHTAGLAALASSLNDVLPPRRRAKLEQEARAPARRASLPTWPRRRTARGARHAPAITEIAARPGTRCRRPRASSWRSASSFASPIWSPRPPIPTHDPLRPPRHRPGGEPACCRAGRLHARRHRRRRRGRDWRAGEADRLGRVQATLDEVAGEGTLTRFAPAGGGRPAQRAGGGRAAPSASASRARARVRPDPQPAEPGPLVSARRGLVPDRHHAAAGHRQRGREHLLVSSDQAAAVYILARGAPPTPMKKSTSQLPGRHMRRRPFAHRSGLNGMRVADRPAVAFDDPRQRSGALQRQRDLASALAALPHQLCTSGLASHRRIRKRSSGGPGAERGERPRSGCHQCRKWRTPVNTMARPARRRP